MKQKPPTRKELKNKMATALKENIEMLSPGMQNILLDDLVTAFENRRTVLDQAQSKLQYYVDLGIKVSNKTL